MLVNDVIYNIRGMLGDLQNTRWTDLFIITEINRANERMLSLLKRYKIDLGMERLKIIVPKNATEFDLPLDYRGTVGLYNKNKNIHFSSTEEYETYKTTAPLAMWAINKFKGLIKNAPSEETELLLIYWKQPKRIKELADDMPFEGLLDSAIIDYVAMRLMNYDEMNVAQDERFLQDMETSVLTIALSRNPTVLQPKGWLS